MVGWGLLAGLCGLVAAQAAPANTQSIYTCVDKQGRKLTSDRPIPECIDREQRELSPTGTVRRVIGPTLTEHERAAREVERRKSRKSATASPMSASASAFWWPATLTRRPTMPSAPWPLRRSMQ